MTPFMLRVAEIVGADTGPDPLPVPETRPTTPTSGARFSSREAAARPRVVG